MSTFISLGFVGDTPIANDIFTILDNEGILLLEYPIRSDNEKPAFSAALIYSKEGNKELAFIGLNTADYFDGFNLLKPSIREHLQ